jgi:hypothetical protein
MEEALKELKNKDNILPKVPRVRRTAACQARTARPVDAPARGPQPCLPSILLNVFSSPARQIMSTPPQNHDALFKEVCMRVWACRRVQGPTGARAPTARERRFGVCSWPGLAVAWSEARTQRH